MASFSVVTNIASSNAQANLHTTSLGLQKALTRLSSGYRINNSGDDAAGLAVANSYRSDTAVINQGIRNANDGLSVLQMKDGALNNISTLLDRLSTLATQAANGGLSQDTLDTLDAEFTSVTSEITREATVAGLDGSGFSVFVSNAATAADGKVTSSNIQALDLSSLGLDSSSLSTQANAEAAVASIADAVVTLGGVQGEIGALQNRLQFAVSLAQSQVVNNQAAEARIRDANIAEESANMTRYNILSQSGIAALAQANAQPQNVLSLLR
jgi:flagellin